MFSGSPGLHPGPGVGRGAPVRFAAPPARSPSQSHKLPPIPSAAPSAFVRSVRGLQSDRDALRPGHGGAGVGSASGRRLCSREACNLNPMKGHLYSSSKSVTFLAVTRSALPSALPPSPGVALPHLHFPSRDALIFLFNRGRVVEAAYLGLRMPEICRKEHQSQRLHWNSKRTGWRLKGG